MSLITPYNHEEEGVQPPLLYPDYKSSVGRAPSKPLIPLPQTLTEITGPVFGHDRLRPNDSDLTRQGKAPPIGDRIIVMGRVTDENDRPIRNTLIEIWQANAAGRYFHPNDTRDVPLDPNFTGGGRAVTDDDGWYRFITIKPGRYPWHNHENAWRPAHIHFSLFGPSFITRLVTQMYFEGDALLPYDPIYLQVPEAHRHKLISHFDYGITDHEIGIGFRFDIVLRGRAQTPFEEDTHEH
ncbi:protocatechuate 3,4-dioxygenase subunit beta [Actibacterium sp. D379-3]